MTMIDSARATMEKYLEALVARGNFGEYFSDDVTIEVVSAGQTARGRAGVEGMIRALHEQMFDGKPELRTLVVEGNHAALEADFVARHIGEFAGIAPTGRELRVPYSVIYDLDGGRITALRIYGMASDLIRELSG